MDKNIIRRRMLYLRQQMNLKDAILKNDLITSKLLASEYYQQASAIITYLGSKGEVDTVHLIEQAFQDQKKVALPKVFKNGIMKFYFISSLEDLVLSQFGIFEPDGLGEEAVSSDQSLFIVPLIAFDEQLNRIGYGKGYYDLYLSKLEKKVCIGFAFEMQKVEQFDAEAWDVPLNLVITEQNIYQVRD